jgi:FMN phosphatase YigB (HAD superfamily)
MVGDSAEKDIGGGHTVGLRTAWVTLDREWPADLVYRPEITGRTGAAALRAVIQDTVERG